MPHGKLFMNGAACLALVVGCALAGNAWADQQTSGDGSQSETAHHAAPDRAWTINGMQVVKPGPKQQSRVYAVTKPEGVLAITHNLAEQLLAGDE